MRLPSFFGAFLTMSFYFGDWDVVHDHVDGDFVYVLVFLAVAAFDAGRSQQLVRAVRFSIRQQSLSAYTATNVGR